MVAIYIPASFVARAHPWHIRMTDIPMGCGVLGILEDARSLHAGCMRGVSGMQARLRPDKLSTSASSCSCLGINAI